MPRSLLGILAVLAVVVSAVSAWGEESPVILTHTLTGYSKAEKTVTLEYAVQVQNREVTTLAALSLALVPHPPFTKTNTTVTVENLAPKAKATRNVKIVTSLLRDRNYFARLPLPWAGTYNASNGKVVEFPVTSGAGGAK